MQMKQPGNLRASLNHYASTPEKSAQLAELAKKKLTIPVMAWGGRSSFACHCIDSARSMAPDAEGGVIEECGHWAFEEKADFIVDQLRRFWAKAHAL